MSRGQGTSKECDLLVEHSFDDQDRIANWTLEGMLGLLGCF